MAHYSFNEICAIERAVSSAASFSLLDSCAKRDLKRAEHIMAIVRSASGCARDGVPKAVLADDLYRALVHEPGDALGA